MTIEQREKFDRLIVEETMSSSRSTTGAEMAQRKAFALSQGEIG